MKYFFKTVLLIDDNEIDNILHEILITKGNFAEQIIVKFSSDDALDFLKDEAIEKNQIPDLIFLDIRMPLSDGFQFLEAYQNLPAVILNHTKIVMLTSSLDDKDHARTIENKFVQFLLSKPLTIDGLEDLKKKLNTHKLQD
jgi:CheY-like chemotaxis protein